MNDKQKFLEDGGRRAARDAAVSAKTTTQGQTDARVRPPPPAWPTGVAARRRTPGLAPRAAASGRGAPRPAQPDPDRSGRQMGQDSPQMDPRILITPASRHFM